MTSFLKLVLYSQYRFHWINRYHWTLFYLNQHGREILFKQKKRDLLIFQDKKHTWKFYSFKTWLNFEYIQDSQNPNWIIETRKLLRGSELYVIRPGQLPNSMRTQTPMFVFEHECLLSSESLCHNYHIN